MAIDIKQYEPNLQYVTYPTRLVKPSFSHSILKYV